MNIRYLHRLRYFFEWVFYFTRFFFRQFYQQRGLQIASSLAYATLLALVPLITVMFGFLGGLPVFENVGNTIQTYIFNNFVPAFGETVLAYLRTFSQKASQLTITGLVMIFLIAIMLMATIDNAFNTIWHIRNRRNPVARFLVYWAILTMGPLLVGVGMFSTSYILSLPAISDVDSGFGLKERFLSWLPFLTTSVAFTILYILVPNCFVLRRHAMVGGITAALLFEFAKYGFGIYVRNIASFETIYGTLAVVPIFLIWIYTSWVVLILGAHITFCLSAFRFSMEKRGRKDNEWSFSDVYQVIYLLWLAQKEGKSMSSYEVRRGGVKAPQYQINEIMGHLQRVNWVQNTGTGTWILSRDMDELSVMDFVKIVPRPLPLEGDEENQGANPAGFEDLLSDYHESLAKNLNVPLSQLLQKTMEHNN
ncbi:MAG: YihY family inner membrane protein [Gammaproteobacteria bacterium]|nr:YihY family inner membrane protein [Gammaproteobacteria bacterium]